MSEPTDLEHAIATDFVKLHLESGLLRKGAPIRIEAVLADLLRDYRRKLAEMHD